MDELGAAHAALGLANAWVDALVTGQTVEKYLTAQATQTVALLGTIQTQLDTFRRGLLPSGALASWRRGIWQ